MSEMGREQEQQSPKCTFIHYCIQLHKWETLEKRHNNVKVKGNGQNIGLHREEFLRTRSPNLQFNICWVRNCSRWFNPWV